jgi:hypothetical protein
MRVRWHVRDEAVLRRGSATAHLAVDAEDGNPYSYAFVDGRADLGRTTSASISAVDRACGYTVRRTIERFPAVRVRMKPRRSKASSRPMKSGLRFGYASKAVARRRRGHMFDADWDDLAARLEAMHANNSRPARGLG